MYTHLIYRLLCWGDCELGNCYPPEGTFRDVDAGWWHTCAVTTEDKVLCWGSGYALQEGKPWVCMYLYMLCIYMCVCVCVCVCVVVVFYECACMCMFICICVYTYNIQTHTHTFAQHMRARPIRHTSIHKFHNQSKFSWYYTHTHTEVNSAGRKTHVWAP